MTYGSLFITFGSLVLATHETIGWKYDKWPESYDKWPEYFASITVKWVKCPFKSRLEVKSRYTIHAEKTYTGQGGRGAKGLSFSGLFLGRLP